MYDQYIEFNYELEKATKHLFGVLISGLALASISLIVSLTIFCKSMIGIIKEIRVNKNVNAGVAGIMAGLANNGNGLDRQSIKINNDIGAINNSGRPSGAIDQSSQIIDNSIDNSGGNNKKGLKVKTLTITSEQYNQAGGNNASLLTLKGIIPDEYLDFTKYEFLSI